VGVADDIAGATDEPETAGVLSVETALMGPVAGGSFACVGDGIQSPLNLPRDYRLVRCVSN
ncbi:MAG: hypothetical protein WBE38_04890, partial [Terracidiphilus sp.]